MMRIMEYVKPKISKWDVKWGGFGLSPLSKAGWEWKCSR